MKLSPKIATFCPGCGHKNLELKSVPTLIIKAEKKEPTKRISIIGTKTKSSKNGLF